MDAGQVKRIMKEWVDTSGCKTPGFLGAHLMGALVYMPDEAPFPPYRDTDLCLVVTQGTQEEPLELVYQGLILEVGLYNTEKYSSPETVLGDAGLAPNLAVPSTLSDPTGWLASLQTSVEAEYARRKWVQARCDQEKKAVDESFTWLPHITVPHQALCALAGSFGVGLAGLVAAACLKPPTHRRAFVLMRELLEPEGFGPLQEELLEIFGFAHLAPAQVKRWAADLAETFDRAVQVVRTPGGLNFKLQPHIRPYLVDASLEMIASGDHREAAGWAAVFLCTANDAIQADGLPEEKAYFRAKVDRLLAEVGWEDMRTYPARLQHARELADRVNAAADTLVACNPKIFD
jgi:hypothetical protein